MNTFFTFESDTSENLNRDIRTFCEDNHYIEIERSAPAVVFSGERLHVFVTCKLRCMKETEVDEIESKDAVKKRRLLKHKIDELNLSGRANACLRRAGFNFIEDIVSKSKHELMKTKNLGEKLYQEIDEKLKKLGFEIKEKK